MSTTPEQQPRGPEQAAETYEAAHDQKEKLQNKLERAAELSPRDAEAAAERAKIEALESAVSIEAGGAERKKPTDPSPAHRRGPISKKQKDASFKKQIKEVQAELSPTSRAFSKIIHNKAIEKTSEVVGSTVARPNAILAGAVVAFALTLAVYVIAKNIGYKLSGFETIAAFAVGWIIGNLYDYLRLIITGKK